MSARLKGDEKLEAALRRQNPQVLSKMNTAIQSGLKLITNDAKQRVPVQTGNLKRSLHDEVEGLEGWSGTDVEYADDVEYGTSKQRAKPYLRPAFDENKENAINEMKQALKELEKDFRR